MAKEKQLITAQALAAALNLSVETVWKYTREKKIPYIDLGNRQYRYVLSEVVDTLAGTVREEAGAYRPKGDGKFTYQDYLKLPEEPGYRYEVLDGVLVKEPSPTVLHQRVSRRLMRILEDFFWKTDPSGEVLAAPLDVTFQDVTVVQPDIFYIAGNQKEIVQDARIDGAPRLVVEIISPSSSRKDRLQKMQIYQKAQVRHYWIVNPDEKTMECFALRSVVYALVAAGLDEDVITHPDFAGLYIDLETLWR
jgi:Uma2 family endonuclease/predicted DNA-binding transcriptional regulator AlpA